jgi:hypothetical protein
MRPLLIALAALLAVYLLRPDQPPAPKPVWTKAEKAYIAKQHKRHGIFGSVRDDRTGEHYFTDKLGRKARL